MDLPDDADEVVERMAQQPPERVNYVPPRRAYDDATTEAYLARFAKYLPPVEP